MFDFIYSFAEWFLTYDFTNGWVYDSSMGSQYEFILVSVGQHSVYILSLIAFVLIAWFVLVLTKNVVYMLLDTVGR